MHSPRRLPDHTVVTVIVLSPIMNSAVVEPLKAEPFPLISPVPPTETPLCGFCGVQAIFQASLPSFSVRFSALHEVPEITGSGSPSFKHAVLLVWRFLPELSFFLVSSHLPGFRSSRATPSAKAPDGK